MVTSGLNPETIDTYRQVSTLGVLSMYLLFTSFHPVISCKITQTVQTSPKRIQPINMQ